MTNKKEFYNKTLKNTKEKTNKRKKKQVSNLSVHSSRIILLLNLHKPLHIHFTCTRRLECTITLTLCIPAFSRHPFNGVCSGHVICLSRHFEFSTSGKCRDDFNGGCPSGFLELQFLFGRTVYRNGCFPFDDVFTYVWNRSYM